MSVFCALLAASLVQSLAFIVMEFFCSQHTNQQDRDFRLRALLRILINQVLLYPDKPEVSLGLMDDNLLDGLQKHDPVVLCLVFEELVRQSSLDKTGFFIIDGVSDFEGLSYS